MLGLYTTSPMVENRGNDTKVYGKKQPQPLLLFLANKNPRFLFILEWIYVRIDRLEVE